VNKIIGFPTGITILQTQSLLTEANSTPITPSQGIYNHHVAWINADKPPVRLLSCGNGTSPSSNMPISIFSGSGEESGDGVYNTMDNNTLLDVGYWIAPKSNVVLEMELVNYSEEPKFVFQVVDIHYIERQPAYDASIETLNVLRCDSEALGVTPEKGKKNFALQSKEMVFNEDGYILNMRTYRKLQKMVLEI
jgi:hypothetical protein